MRACILVLLCAVAGPSAAADSDAAVAELERGRALSAEREWDAARAALERALELGLPASKQTEARLDLEYVRVARTRLPSVDSAPREKPWTAGLTLVHDVTTDLARRQPLRPGGDASRDEDALIRALLDFEYRAPVGEGTASVRYGLSQTRHSDLDELDSQTHSLGARYATTVSERTRISGGLEFGHTLLDHESLSAAYGFDAGAVYRWSWRSWSRVGYAFRAHDARLNDQQDALGHTAHATQIWSLGDAGHVLSIGYVFGRDLADTSTISFHRHGANASLQINPLAGSRIQMRVASDWYDYDGTDPIEGKKRDDWVVSGSLRYDAALTRWAGLFAEITWRNVDSNLARQEYDSTRLSIGTTFRY